MSGSNLTADGHWLQCPSGLAADPLARYSGCNIDTGVIRAAGWLHLLTYMPSILLWFYTAAKLHLDDPTASPARVRGLFEGGVGMVGVLPGAFHLAFRPRIPLSADRALVLTWGIGTMLMIHGMMSYTFNHLVGRSAKLMSH